MPPEDDQNTESPPTSSPAKHRVPKSAFTRETAKAASEKAAQKRREKAAGASSREAVVIVPLELDAVIQGLRDKAKQGNAQAASALLAYLTRFPVQLGDGTAALADKPFAEMTAEELTLLEALAVRKANRALRLAAHLVAATEGQGS